MGGVPELRARGKARTPGVAKVAILGGVGTLEAEALALMLAESGHRVLGIYPDARALRAELSTRSTELHAVLVDGDDPASGTSVVPAVRRNQPTLKILLLCETLTPSIVRCVLEENVEGVALKSDTAEEVIVALSHVLRGHAVMPAGWQSVPVEPERDPLDTLSVREREVLELAARGLRNREIAEQLMISPNTVKFHLRAIYTRLGVRNRVQAMHAIASAQNDDSLVQESTSGESKDSDQRS